LIPKQFTLILLWLVQDSNLRIFNSCTFSYRSCIAIPYRHQYVKKD